MSASGIETGAPDFVRAMGPVARELLGKPTEDNKAKHELRFGARGSLSVSLDKGTWHDHEAGRGGGVLDLVRDRKHLDRDGAIMWLRERGHLPKTDKPKGGKPRIVATYDYHDETGVPLFQVRRMDPKNFIQARADGNGGWICKAGCMGGVRLVPYRLPAVVAAVASGRTIYIAEGEKGVHALESLGLVGTCSPGGAGKFHKISNAPFAGADVVILPDNDPQATEPDGTPRWHPDGRPKLPGQDHAADVARNLCGVAAKVRVVMLPGLPIKGDVADWVAAGGTREDLEGLAASQPPEDTVPGAPDARQTDDPPPPIDDPGYYEATDAAGDRHADQEPDAADPRPKREGRDRSHAAMRIGAGIRRDGGTFEDMVEELRTNPETEDWFQRKGQRDNQRELKRIWKKTEPKKSKTGLPIIYNAAGRLHLIATDAEHALVKSRVPLYQRGKTLVRPVVTDVPASRGRTTKAAGLDEIKFHGILDLMAQTAAWQRWDAKAETWADDDPSSQAANILLSRAGSWTFPRIAGIVTTPTLRPDGTVLLAAGYDPATRLFHVKDETLDLSTLPASPVREDAERALRLLKGLLTEFPFAEGVNPAASNVDRAVALSGIITPVVRGAISVAPLHAVKATTAGTGKSFLVDIISAIATGRICPVASAGEDQAETEKRLVGLLLAGYPVVSIDNCNGELGGDLLCQAVERPLVRVRALGRSEIFEIESRATIYATGNALRVCGDMVRRTLVSTLDAGVERPELREFKGNPVTEVLEARGWYVAACLTIVMAYQAAGCPDMLPALASFEDWSGLVRSALVWLGEADPCKSMETAREDDPELSTLREMMGLWRAGIGTGLDYAQTVRQVAETASSRAPTQMGEPTDFLCPDLRDALLRIAGAGGTINTKRAGNWLADHEGRIVGGMMFKRHPTLDRTGVVRWAVVPVKTLQG
jgi:hypothetical protein